MARLARGQYLDPQTIQITHVVTRCVRRAFLCGEDPVTKQSFEHRRKWIRDRLEFLASVFAIDCLTFAVMSNHLHLILRSRPDIVRGWSDTEVAERWLRLCPPRRGGKQSPAQDSDIAMISNDPRRLAELRVRLSDVSWWMRMTAQKIARQANREDNCTGRFWEGRFKAQLLLDEAAVLACAMYVDLNPIRAALAESLEDSMFTGAKARIEDLKASKLSGEIKSAELKSGKPNGRQTWKWERSKCRLNCGWLSPVEIQELDDPIGADPSSCGRRASLKGFLAMPLLRYLELLDWTGRQFQRGKSGVIPAHIQPILKRIGIQAQDWMDLARNFTQVFKRAAGSRIALAREAQDLGQAWLHAPGADYFD